MADLPGRIHIVVGGPFTEVAHVLRHRQLRRKLGYLTAQAGLELSKRAIYSKLAFNVDVDLLAALEVFVLYPQKMFYVPSDITRHPSVTFKSAEELIRLGIHPEIGQIFLEHRAQAEERHKQEQLRRQALGKEFRPYPALSIHDLQAVLALSQVLGYEKKLYQFAPIEADTAISNLIAAAQMRSPDSYSPPLTPKMARKLGHLDANRTTRGQLPGRYVVTAQNAGLYKRRVRDLLGPL